MADIRFYHLKTQTVSEALPAILMKALSGGRRVVVRLGDDKAVETLCDHLWTYRADSFIPHGSAKDGHAANQPVWITARDENPNGADVLVTTHAMETGPGDFGTICEMITDHEPDSVTAARGRWKTYKDAGHDVTYWLQTDAGGWEKKA